jgi:hypothetical protein
MDVYVFSTIHPDYAERMQAIERMARFWARVDCGLTLA